MKHWLKQLDHKRAGQNGRVAILRSVLSPVFMAAVRACTNERLPRRLHVADDHEFDQCVHGGGGGGRSCTLAHASDAALHPSSPVALRFLGTTLLVHMATDHASADHGYELACGTAAAAGVVPGVGQPPQLMPFDRWYQICHNLAMRTKLAIGPTDVTGDPATAWKRPEGVAYAWPQRMTLCNNAVVSIDDLMVSWVAVRATHIVTCVLLRS